MAERDLPYEVPKLRYVKVQPYRPVVRTNDTFDWWGDQSPIAPCVRCGRYTKDPNRDRAGNPSEATEDPDDDREPVCLDCLEEAYVDGLKRVMEGVVDERLELGEKGRASLRKVVELVVTEPEKVLELKDLGNKVRTLEKQTNLLWTVYVSAILALLVALAAIVVSVVT